MEGGILLVALAVPLWRIEVAVELLWMVEVAAIDPLLSETCQQDAPWKGTETCRKGEQ